MENWTVLAARRHQEFENYVLAKSHHKLDFSDLDLSNVKTITSIDLYKETKNDLSSQLKSLNELYESGALTKEEFIKAGGEKFKYIPCLNDKIDHVSLIENLMIF